MNVYCTYFDVRYLSRGLALVESLRRHGDTTPIVILSLDTAAAEHLERLALPDVTVVTVPALESMFPQLLSAKTDRSGAEYYFTLTPWLCLYALRSTGAAMVTYLDADLYFFAGTDPVHEIIGDLDVAIVPHRFPEKQKWREKFGTFNVGWVSFRATEAGQRCLQWWADSCLAWCYDVVDDGRFADQGYLDSFAEVIEPDRIRVIEHPGVNLAPWNLARHEVTKSADGQLEADGQQVIFFHFHGLQQVGTRYYFKHAPYGVRTHQVILDELYRPYILELRAKEALFSAPRTEALARRTSLGSMVPGRKQLLRLLARVRGDSLSIAP